MQLTKNTYRQFLKGCILLTVLFTFNYSFATSNQNIINKATQSLGIGIANTAPVTAFNSIANEYLVAFVDSDVSCTGDQRLFGIIINSLTGETKGNRFEISNCNIEIKDLKLVYNPNQNEYGIVYKSNPISGGYKILFRTINASTKEVSSINEIDTKSLSDPFNHSTLSFSNNYYSIGYQETFGSTDFRYIIKYYESLNKSLTNSPTIIQKTDFLDTSNGVKNSFLSTNNQNVFICFELDKLSGTEIWGGTLNPVNGNLNGNYFQLSPSPNAGVKYLNPTCSNTSIDNRVLILYEESHDQVPTASLNRKIKAQLLNPSNQTLLSPINQSVTNLPIDPGEEEHLEDSKLPRVVFSDLSNEFFIYFYGRRWINEDANLYHNYLQRLEADNLTTISSESIKIDSDIGTLIINNNSLKKLDCSYNDINNQYLITWFNESNNEILTQIWRYDNNPPKNLSISNATISEELTIGSTFAAISATDPDPEDNSLTYSLVGGSGSQDNSFFSIEGNALKTSKRISFEEATSRTIRIRATDEGGAFIEKSFVITITNINEKPTNLALQPPFTIQENLIRSTFTTLISADDDDLNSILTYSLVSGDSSDNNSNFEIESGTNTLTLIASLNYEDTSRQYVRIRATDETGLSNEKAFMFEVEDVNEGPETLTLTPTSLPENDIQSKAIVDVIDPDDYSNYLFSKPPTSGEDDNDSFLLSGNELRPLVQLNFEAKNQYKVRLRASDGVYDTTQTIIITITDVNDNPDSILLSKNQIEAGQDAGALIGYLTTYDQDVDDTHVYSIVNGADLFFINGNELHALNTMTYDDLTPANNEYSLVVKSTDSQNGEKLENITIEVVLFRDDEKPEIFDFEEVTYVDEKTSSTILSIKASDNEALDTVQFFYRQIRSEGSFIKRNDLLEIDIQDSKLYFVDTEIDLTLFDEMGIEYYFKVIDAANNSDSIKGYVYKSFIEKLFTPTDSPYDGTLEAYKIITNPYDVESKKVSKIFSDYGSSTDLTWRLFSYQNKITQEIGTKTSETMNQGHGYWFNKMEILPQAIEFENAYVPQNNQDNLFSMNLVKGWNLIGNPYPFAINWADVLTHNGFVENEIELITFNKVYKENSKILNEFEGGFIFVENAVSNFEFPLSVTSGARIAENTNEEHLGWGVNFILDNGKLKNTLGGFGMNEQALASYDKYDRPLLPTFIDQLDISFSHPEHFTKAFSRDIVELKESHIWEFVTSTNQTGKNITLSWDLEKGPKSTNKLVLYDVLNDRKINMKTESQYSFTSDQAATFKAIYGSETFVKDALSKIRIEALQPYPNPFSDQVTIPINLPFSKNTYTVETRVYDLLGEVVFDQKLDNIHHGLLQLEWTEDQNKKLKQGIYIYSIKVKNGFLTNTFHGRVVKN